MKFSLIERSEKMISKDLEKTISNLVTDLKPVNEEPKETILYESLYFDRSEQDNQKWVQHISSYLLEAKKFEIHCWNEESEWLDIALQYGEKVENDWHYGQIVVGDVTPQFVEMILSIPKPKDTEIYNKMTPFFNLFLDDKYQSCHYGTEIYY